MKFKTLTLAVLSSLTLAACGGGSDHSNRDDTQTTHNNNQNSNGSSNSNTNNNAPIRWSNFRVDYHYQNNVNLSLDVTETEFNIVNGQLYAVLNDYDDQEIYLTNTGEYLGIGPIHSQYSALLGNIQINNDQFTIQPYSQTGAKGLIFNQENKRIDLSGKPVLVALEPYLNWNVNYPAYSSNTFEAGFLSKLKDYQKLTFPQGAVCLQETKYTNNQDYLTLFQSSNDNKKLFEDYATAYLNNVYHQYVKITQYLNATAYLYSYDQDPTNADYGVAEYQGRYYAAYKEAKGVEYDLAAYIQEAKDNAADPTLSAEEKAAYLAYANDLSQGCDLYNDVAIQFLKQNIK